MTETSCPICNGDYWDIFDAVLVCEEHQEWLVTYCYICKHHVFSPYSGICIPCLNTFLLRKDILEFLSIEVVYYIAGVINAEQV